MIQYDYNTKSYCMTKWWISNLNHYPNRPFLLTNHQTIWCLQPLGVANRTRPPQDSLRPNRLEERPMSLLCNNKSPIFERGTFKCMYKLIWYSEFIGVEVFFKLHDKNRRKGRHVGTGDDVWSPKEQRMARRDLNQVRIRLSWHCPRPTLSSKLWNK